MKKSDEQLKQLIQEEVNMLEEDWWDRLRARMSGAGAALGELPTAIGQGVSGFMGRGADRRTPGAYNRAKAEKIVTIAANKLERLFDEFVDELEEEIDEFREDLEKLGIAPAEAEITASGIIQQQLDAFVEDVKAEFGAVFFEEPPTPLRSAAAPAAPAATPAESEEEQRERFRRFAAQSGQLAEHFKRFL